MSLPALNIVGNPDNHDQVAMKVITGKHDFASDRMPLVKYYGAIRPAPFTRGKITSVDSTEAMKIPGVMAVVTYEDVPDWRQDVLYWGQPAAGVVADDPYTAELALTKITINYEPGTAVVDPDAAIQPGAPLSGIFPDTNQTVQTNLTRGAGASAVTSAEVVADTTFGWTTVHQHDTLEPHNVVAWWIDDDFYFWTGSQHIHSARTTAVNTLGLASAYVHAYTHFTGCGHGDKTGAPLAGVSAIMSKKVNGHPVEVRESRKVNVLSNSRQFQVRSAIKLGAKKDGTFTAMDASWTSMGGAGSFVPSGNVHFGIKNTYTIPDAQFNVNMITTNSPQRGFWRCVNDPPGNINSDSAIDKLAALLSMDPYTLRTKNIRPAYAPDQDPPGRVWGNGGAGVAIKMAFDKLYQESGYAQKWHAPGQNNVMSDGRLHGIAITGHIDSHGGVSGGSRGGIVTMTPDGQLQVNVGGARGCEGGPTMCCIVAAETMGMNYADVRLGEWGNTDVSLDAGIQAGSGFTGGAGSAFIRAAEDCRAKVFAAALTKAPLNAISGITIDDLDAENSEIFYKTDPTKRMTYRAAMSRTAPTAGAADGWNASSSGSGQGLQRTREGLPDVGTAVNTNGGAAACAEVAVDPNSGEVEILGMWNAVDTGRTIFKRGTEKEMNSGNELMVWQSMFAGDVFDPGSACLIGSQYDQTMMMTTLDLDPTKFNTYDIESDDMAGPWGAHGIGEPCVTNVSCIINAIFNATGKWVNPRGGPILPDIVLNSIDPTKANISTSLLSR